MLELEVVLDFRCRCCGQDMGVTLKCTGPGLASGLDSLAFVKAPCPTCGNNNKIYFTPRGTLYHVEAERQKFEVPEFSCN